MGRERRLFACPLKLPCMNTGMTESATESIKSSLLELLATFVNNSIDTVIFLILQAQRQTVRVTVY